MKVGSVFAGIGGFDLGLERAGMQISWQIEIDPACQKVLASHWPNVRRYADVRAVEGAELEPVDIICGGFPCVDVSVAGRRTGLAGPQSSLYWEFHRLVAILTPRWIIVENVPGLLSSRNGRDFKLILDSLVELGYSVAWRIFNAQHFGLAQRRKRVFVVGYFGRPWSAPGAVLLEPEVLPVDSPADGTKAQEPPSFVASSIGASRKSIIGGLIGAVVSRPITTKLRRLDPTSETLIVDDSFRVRRLTPLECERLQGFPDNWTAGHSNTVRYRMLGNAVPVPIIEWIGKRIMAFERYNVVGR